MTDTMVSVAPQKRGLVNTEDQARISAALAAREAAEDEVRAAVVEAMRNGASVRMVAEASGLSTNTVSRWKRATS